ncbi:hypothetical protein KY345_00775 [Candidatus Woesearchaeota archaeon]|nr:hypothetical protein [Candidatus Woesearchaeota archaeon]
MKLNKIEKVMLYTLGRYYEVSQRAVSSKTLAIHLPKSVFIDFVKKVKLFEKGERAIYRNLEYLEGRKLISYENRNLRLTERGKKQYREIRDGLRPYFEVNNIIIKDKVKKSKKLQTIFKIFR